MKTKTDSAAVTCCEERSTAKVTGLPSLASLKSLFVVLSLAGFIQTASAPSVVNGFGGGSVRVSVWCNPAAPPAGASASAFDSTGRFTSGATASIPGAPPNGAPLPPACTPGTNITGTNVAFWDTTWAGAEVGGDKTAGDGTSLLETLVSKYSSSSYSVSASGSIVDATHAQFTGSYFLSNSDAAFAIEWYSTQGNGIDSSQSGWILLDSIPETIGTASGVISKEIFDPYATSDPYGIKDDLVMEIDVAGTSLPGSTPEPSSLALLGTGVLGVGGVLRRRLHDRG
jgi:PEP-CTERM motif